MADAGYITDLDYTWGFVDHLAPAAMNYVAAINGYRPRPIDGEFTYCELGCGRGHTSLLLAATHPRGRFWACDINPRHVERARRLAIAGGVGNVAFLEAGIDRMRAADLPAFDFVALHGVYSWVSAAVRAEIHAFLRHRLKPGGLATISYNAMPGWATLQPLRRLIRAHADGVAGDSATKARAAVEYVRRLSQGGARYFAAHPDAAEVARTLAERDIRYLAHEYVTPHGDAFYFADVHAAMREAGLAFAGNMAPAENYADLSVPPPLQELARSLPSRAALEAHRDFIADTRFRRDLYAAQPEVPRTGAVPLERLDAVAFRLVDAPPRLPLQGAMGGLRFDLAGHRERVAAVHRLLERAPASASEIHAALGELPAADASTFLQQLVVAKHLEPCPPPRATAAPGWTALDTVLLDDAIHDGQVRTLVGGRRSGQGHFHDITVASLLEALAQGADAAGAAARAGERIRATGRWPLAKRADGTSRELTDAEAAAQRMRICRGLLDAAHPDTRLMKIHGIVG